MLFKQVLEAYKVNADKEARAQNANHTEKCTSGLLFARANVDFLFLDSLL